jgi:hypothetical protein
MLLLVPLAIVVIIVLVLLVSRFFTDYLWYQEMGYTTVFWTRIWARLAVMVGFGAVFFIIFYGNLLLARRLTPDLRPAGGSEDGVFDLVEKRRPRTRRLMGIAAVVIAILFAIGYGGSWTTIWTFLQQSAFGFAAPVFERDAAFFVFTLPFMRMILTFVMVAFLLAFLGSLLMYVSQRAITLGRQEAEHLAGCEGASFGYRRCRHVRQGRRLRAGAWDWPIPTRDHLRSQLHRRTCADGVLWILPVSPCSWGCCLVNSSQGLAAPSGGRGAAVHHLARGAQIYPAIIRSTGWCRQRSRRRAPTSPTTSERHASIRAHQRGAGVLRRNTTQPGSDRG